MTKRANKMLHEAILRKSADIQRMKRAWIQIGVHGEALDRSRDTVRSFSAFGIGVDTQELPPEEWYAHPRLRPTQKPRSMWQRLLDLWH